MPAGQTSLASLKKTNRCILEPSRTSTMELFRELVNRLKKLHRMSRLASNYASESYSETFALECIFSNLVALNYMFMGCCFTQQQLQRRGGRGL